MATIKDDPLLSGTDGLLTVVMTVMAVGAAALLLAVPGIWIWRDAVIARLLTEYPEVGEPMALVAITSVLLAAALLAALGYLFVRELRATVRTVATGDPLTMENAQRLERMGWIAVLGLGAGSLLEIAAWWTKRYIGEMETDPGVNVAGLMLILVLFILARVFRQGAAMRAELEGTV